MNKVSTKAELRLNLSETRALSQSQKSRLRARYPSACTLEGDFIIVCDETRSQVDNVRRARQRMRDALLAIQKAPPPRRATRPTLGSKRRRMDDKRRRSQVKKSRSGGFD